MSNKSYFWAHLGVLQKVGVWSPYYDEQTVHNTTAQRVYEIYRRIVIGFCSLHTLAECFQICYDFKSLSMSELTVSTAYSIQHFLGIVKVYIIISQQKAIVALDNRTKESPLYRSKDEGFKKSLRSMVNMSDKIGYIYWVAVLTTISFGFVTGIFESYRHKSNMQTKCNDKLNVYLTNYADQMLEWDVKFENGMATVNKINIIENAIKNFNTTIQLVDITCGRPRRVFPYHIWLPFDSKFTPVFQIIFPLNFLAGFLLVCCILPIDLLVMSYMRYIRFQFEVLMQDLLNLQQNSANDLQAISNNNISDHLLYTQMLYRLRNIVHHQLAIFDFFTKTDELFTWVLFAQYLGSSIMICGVLFSVTSVLDDMMTPTFFHVAFFYSGLIFQLYSNCFYGNEVVILSAGIAQCAYLSGWEQCGKYSTQLKPYIIMIMKQSLRPCKLTAGKFSTVDLPTFLAVFKASYTYYTVLADDKKGKHK